MTATDASPDPIATSERSSPRAPIAPYSVVAAVGGVVLCLSLAALFLTPSPMLPVLMALAAGVAMILVGVVAIRRRRVEFALAEAEATVRQLAEATGDLRLKEGVAAPIRDPGTLLLSREFLQESLDLEVRRAAREKVPLTILMIHVAGLEAATESAVDTFLLAAGTALKRQVRSFDIVCRYERDVLAVFMPGLSERQAGRRADELLGTVRKTSVSDLSQSAARPLRASAGFAVHRRHDPPPTSQSLLRRAHLALYKSRAAHDPEPSAASDFDQPPDALIPTH